MNRSGKFKLVALSFALFNASVAIPAVAGGTGNGSAGSGMANHGNGADIPQFTYQADAEKQCKGDAVVWGSSAHPGVFFAAGAGPARAGGFYACMAVARRAGYTIVGGN